MSNRELVILRHAKSAWDTDAPSDMERPLNKRGEKDAPRIGRWLQESGLMPDLVVSSTAERARLTVEAACKELGIKKKAIHWQPAIYEASVATLLQLLAGLPNEPRRVMLVGHNPGLEGLVAYLAKPEQLPAPGYGFLKTATVARLAMPEQWRGLARGSADLLQLQTPKELA